MFPGFRFGDGQLNRPEEIPDVIPILPLRNTVAFPYGVMPIAVGIPRSVQLIEEAVEGDRLIGLVAMKQPELDEPGPQDVYQVGTLAFVQRVIPGDDDQDAALQVIIQGVERFKVEEWLPAAPYLRAQVQLAPESVEESLEVDALTRSLFELARRLANLMPQVPDEVVEFLAGVEDRRLLVYLVASNIRMEMETAQELLEIDALADKMRRLIAILSRELEVLELGEQIRSEAHEEMSKAQREYFLREQLKAIQRELDEGDGQQTEVEEYRQKIEAAEMPEEAEKEALRELDRFEKMPPQAAEYSVIKTYLDWLADLPWNELTEDNLNMDHARQVLDEDHYDLEEVKERVLEFLAVRKLREERGFDFEDVPATVEEGTGAILCFVGPPGVGKTSLGQSIARALERKFTRMSLGGLRDEAEIRGHRRTYIGAMPGRIIQAIKRVETKNPVFMLDEVDKIGADWRGDPSSALLEVLDPAQNYTFRDHYLDVDFDLSQVLFITTANWLDPIPAPLRDRMEIIRLDGYTEYEKVRIAEGYLVPRQVRANGLLADEIEFAESAIRTVIRDYTREAGVRNLEREIGRACRKIAVKIAADAVDGKVEVDSDQAREFLGKPKHQFEAADRAEIPGVATALAVTPAGGEILFVEASRMKGKGNLTLTGQLGDIMKESAQIALSYVRSRAGELGVDPDSFDDMDVHLHVPAGSTPKDGPSAGVAMVTAMASLLTGRTASAELGMTGEITLRGRVLPIGGVKQKVLAGHRAGLKRLLVPQRNEPWLDDVPEEIRESVDFVLVDTIEDVLDAALLAESEALERVA
ncbi:MAG: Lon protease 2 [Anaerolineales bacterium]|nr:Lon protease 2 [Anaerolineales bacterium]